LARNSCVSGPCIGVLILSRAPGDMEKAVKIDAEHVGIIFVRIVGERLCDEDAGIIDECVDATEALERLQHDTFSGLGIGYVTCNRQNVRIGGRLDGAGGRYNAEIAIAVSLDQGFADTLRRAGDDSDFLFCTHDGPP